MDFSITPQFEGYVIATTAPISLAMIAMMSESIECKPSRYLDLDLDLEDFFLKS